MHVAADLGGLLGLYLGGSAISLFEIIDLVAYNFAVQIRHKAAERKHKAKEKALKDMLDKIAPPSPPPLSLAAPQPDHNQQNLNTIFEDDNDSTITTIDI